MLPSKKRRKRYSENRGFTAEPLPPPPPPPPEDSPEVNLFAFFRLSSSQPNLSACYANGDASLWKPGESDSKPGGTASNTLGQLKSGAGGTIRNQSHAPNLDNPSGTREAFEEKGKLSPGEREASNKQQREPISSSTLVTGQYSPNDKVWLTRNSQETNSHHLRQKIQTSKTPPPRSSRTKSSFEYSLAPTVQKRPTSLFRPGQAATFYEDHRLSVQHSKNLRFEPTLFGEPDFKRSMTGGHAHVTNHYQRKRRPLPPIPQDNGVHRRDVGVMTPDEMFDLQTDDAGSTASMTSLTLRSSINTPTGRPPPPRKSRNRIGRRCKIFLLVVPSVVALVSSTMLVLFALGVIGTSQTAYNEDHTARPDLAKTTGLLVKEMGRDRTEDGRSADDEQTTNIGTSQFDITVTPRIAGNHTNNLVTSDVHSDVTNNATTTSNDPETTRSKAKNRNKPRKTSTQSTMTRRKSTSVTSQSEVKGKKKGGGKGRRGKGRKNRRNRVQDETRSVFENPKRVLTPRGGMDLQNAILRGGVKPSTANKELIFNEKTRSSSMSTSDGGFDSGTEGQYWDQDRESFYNEYGSGNQILVSDDEDEVINNESSHTNQEDSLSCLPIPDQVCDAVLPYRMTFRSDTDGGLIRSAMMSLVTQALRNQSSSCNEESALRFICALRHPKCNFGQSEELQQLREFPCKAWCKSLMASCLDDESFSLILALQHGDVTLHDVTGKSLKQLSAKLSRTRRYNLVQMEDTVGSNAHLISYTCDVIINGDVTVTSSPYKCVDLSSVDKFMESQDIVNETTTPPCGSESFHCPGGGCLDKRWLCDGINDCGAMEDEIDCVCSLNEFQCSSGQCVNQRKRCDGFHDCVDRSDEKNCECGDNLATCGDGQCILNDWWCDGDSDCNNGVDELNCDCASRGLESCGNDTCIPARFICDGEEDCVGGSDESRCQYVHNQQCKLWEISCDDHCISVTKRCDGITDCFDNSDEQNCGTCEPVTLEVCQQTHFNVTSMPNFLGHKSQSESTMAIDYVMLTSGVHTRCHPLLSHLGCSVFVPPVPLGSITCALKPNPQVQERVLPCRSFCEEVKYACSPALRSVTLSWPKFLDCEEFPVKSSRVPCYDPRMALREEYCASDQFLCNSTESTGKRCISMASRCDGINHCDDGSDEVDCNCEALGRFECRSNKRCILSSWVCDSHKDCPDSSDELNCDRCDTTQKACTDHTCVSKSMWCDGNRDCPDGSDETDCLRLVSRNQWRLRQGSTDGIPYGRSGGILIGYSQFTSQWHPICATLWDGPMSHLACNQMGFSEALSFSPVRIRNRARQNSLRISDNHRVRKVQETFLGNGVCKLKRFVHVTCKPKMCGKRRDVTDTGKVLPRILGGRTSRDSAWPWLASLTLPGMDHVCGATVVHPRWVVSAAHCFQERMNVRIWRARVDTIGRNALRLSSVFNVTNITVHPRYDPQAVDFDIALVKLSREVPDVNPLCFPSNPFHTGSFCIIAGWGVSGRTQEGAQKLQEGSVHVIDRSTCQRYYPNHVITNRMLCAGKVGVVDACSGDSGGPLMCWQPLTQQWQLAGITSWGSSCKPHSAPGVYTDVKYFASWAERTIGVEAYG